jgi:hypothetical protein
MADWNLGAFGGLFGQLQPGLRHFEKHKFPHWVRNIARNSNALGCVRTITLDERGTPHFSSPYVFRHITQLGEELPELGTLAPSKRPSLAT